MSHTLSFLRKPLVLLGVLAVLMTTVLVAVSSAQPAKAIGGGVLYNNSSHWLGARDQGTGIWTSVAPSGGSSGSKSADIDRIYIGVSCVQFSMSSDGRSWSSWTSSYYGHTRTVNNQMVKARNC